MFKKFGIGMLAIVLAVSFSAFTAVKKELPQKFDEPVLYWYTLDVANQEVPRYATPFAQTEKSNISSPCDPGAAVDCVRGFDHILNTDDGPNDEDAQDQIKTVMP